MEYTLTLTPEDVNIVAEWLWQLPYGNVVNTMNKVVQQVTTQNQSTPVSWITPEEKKDKKPKK